MLQSKKAALRAAFFISANGFFILPNLALRFDEQSVCSLGHKEVLIQLKRRRPLGLASVMTGLTPTQEQPSHYAAGNQPT